MYVANYLSRVGQSVEANKAIARALAVLPDDPSSHYFSAVVSNRDGEFEDVISELENAVRFGYSLKNLEADPEFEDLNDHPRFRALFESKNTPGQ